MEMVKEKFYFLIVFVFCLFLGVFFISVVYSNDAKAQYYLAEKFYNDLSVKVEQQRYRDKWLLCIGEFNKVYKSNPRSPWASAGLYRAGLLYLELYERFSFDFDLLEAIDIFERIIKKFPKSLYCDKANSLVNQINKSKNKKLQYNEKYDLANIAFDALMNSTERQKYRHHWINVISLYSDLYKLEPNSFFGLESLLMMGQLYKGLYEKSYNKKDKLKANNIFLKIHKMIPYNFFPEKSIKSNDELILDKVCVDSKKYSVVKNLRVWSNPNYTRIVLDLDKETLFVHKLFKQDLFLNKFQRLCIDLSKSKLDKNFNRAIKINGKLLNSARVSQFTSDLVRVIVDIKSFKSYKIFTLKNPCRIVLDILGNNEENIKNETNLKKLSCNKKIGKGFIARQLSLGVSKIVIDPGHGGEDNGAAGRLKNIYEKEITLQIANRLAKKIREQLACEVVLTRETDSYISLEERTAIANTENADLFISIHTNAAENIEAHGIETFFLSLASDSESVLVAARENATSTKNISDLSSILNDLIQSTKIDESSRLAFNVQSNLYSHTMNKYSDVIDKGVKRAPFYVLLGAQMPAILVETSFISNYRECKRLTTAQYQETICNGILMGIKEFIKKSK